MKKLRLTTPARARLEEIIEYSIDNFGVEQAIVYQKQLISIAEKLCTDSFSVGRPCSLLFGNNSNTPELLYILTGKHYLIYTETTDTVTIHDFVHVRRNLPAILKTIKERRLR